MLPVPAARVELTARDETGHPVVDVRLVLKQIRGERAWSIGGSGTTDASGVVTIEGVGPGRYKVAPSHEAREQFVDFDANPLASLPEFTLRAEDEVFRGEVVLWRGVEVNCRVAADGVNEPRAGILFDEVDRGTRITLRMGDDTEKVIRLVPGRWAVESVARPGYLLVAVEHDGQPLPGYRIDLDLAAGARRTFLEWTYHSPARLWGKVDFRGEDFGLAIVAELVEPGPWYPAVRARGGSVYRVVHAGVDTRTDDYEMSLPDGTWRVRPESPELESAEPESVPLTVGPGDTARLDWSVEGIAGGGSSMFIAFENESEVRVAPGIAEVWPLGGPGGDAPLVRTDVRIFGGVARPVSPGDYRVVGWHEDYLLGEERIPDWDPDDARRARVEVTLPDGGQVHVEATDEDGRPYAGIELWLDDVDGPPAGVEASDELLRKVMHKKAAVDASGNGWLPGLYPGAWVLRGRHEGDPGLRLVFDAAGGEPAEELSLSVAGKEKVEVRARLVPAASVTATILCDDGEPTGPVVSVMTVETETDPARWTTAELDSEAALRSVERLLGDPERTGLTHGPLEPGSFRLALRPEGHDRWTWAPGTQDPAEASVLQGIAGSPTDLGLLSLDCAPAVWIVPRLASGEPLPDLRSLFPGPGDDDGAVLTGTVLQELDVRQLERTRMEVRADRVGFRGLPEGRADLRLVLRNGFFLPDAPLALEFRGKLERGREVLLEAGVQAVAGAVLVETASHARARVPFEIEEGRPEVRETDVPGGVARLISIPPGELTLELCVDPACERIDRLPVRIEAGEMTETRWPDPR